MKNRTNKVIIFFLFAITILYFFLGDRYGKERGADILESSGTEDSFFDLSGWSNESVRT